MILSDTLSLLLVPCLVSSLAGQRRRHYPLWNEPPAAALWLTTTEGSTARAPRAVQAASQPPQSKEEQPARKVMRHDTSSVSRACTSRTSLAFMGQDKSPIVARALRLHFWRSSRNG
jgi:hypothetical protein